ncbi:MAG: xanthine phosphoribosyltransferase [Micavibrio aeruginosavorus]|uniref:Xanthine phosphoribosyltransferase n=1 Tax=Micavibrio aeruginosavorus TaxID=349221 RepID=A0A7T5UHN0_9BACT|nr:MAG: xanthine phosphoribosyltransferase [Micavibrio aeruginosavorus]
MSVSQKHLDMPLTWDEVNLHAKSLALKLADKGPWKGVIAITTGGMVPACIIARHLKIKHIDTLCISSYDDQSQRKTQIIKHAAGAGNGEGWLVIDDLSDTGNTFRTARELMPKAHYAAIYAKPAGEAAVDTYIMSVSTDTWIHFPWEENEASYIAPPRA